MTANRGIRRANVLVFVSGRDVAWTSRVVGWRVGLFAGLTGVLLAVAGPIGPSAFGATPCSFTSGSDWNTAGDWSCGHVPTASDVAVIDSVSVNVATTTPPVGGIQIVNAGEIHFTASDASISDVGDLVVGNATVSGAGTLSVGGNLIRSSGDFQFAVEATSVVINGAASVIDQGAVCVNVGATLTFNGLLTLEDGSDSTPFNCFTGTVAIGSQGELRSSRTTATVIDTPITNSGVITDSASTLDLFSSGSSTGTLQALDNATTPTQLQLGGDWTVSGTISAVGSGALAMSGDTTTLTPSATLSTPQLDLASTLVLQGSTPQEIPKLTFSGGTLSSTRPVTATTVVAAAGALSGNFTLAVPAGGSFTRTGISTDTFAINAGVTLAINSAGVTSSSGRMTVAVGASLSASQLALSGGGITVDGSLTAPLSLTNGAFLAGSGTTAAVTNTSGSVRPGDPIGTLTVNGTYTQGSGGDLVVDINGTGPSTFDVLAVSGAASLAGHVEANPSIAGHDGNTFGFLTSSSRSGAFASSVGGPVGYFLTYPVSAPYGAVLNWESAPNGTATVMGPHRVGLVDTCTPNFVRATSYSYQWYVNGALVSSLHSSAVRVSESYYLKSMSCVVDATGPGGVTAFQTDWRLIQVGPALAVKSRPYLFRYIRSGVNRTSAKLGVREYATHGVWSPAGTTYTYQWYRGTTKISGAASRYYTPRSSDIGHRIHCIVRAHRRGWTTGIKATVTMPVYR